jgi:predicted nuclease of restriction endonuclease-like (RecB) superfamily
VKSKPGPLGPDLYWQVGEYINAKVESAIWGAGVVKNLASYLKKKEPDLKGFSAQNLWRMKQFYETYRNYEKISTLLRELPWSSHLHILAKTKSIEEKHSESDHVKLVKFMNKLCV